MIGEDRPKAAHAQRPTDDTPTSGGDVLGREKLIRLDVASMIATEPEPVPWIVENLVIRGGLTLLAGLAGQGKSLLAQAVALVAAGAEGGVAAGIVVRPSRVLIVDAENGPEEIHRRLHALRLCREDASRLDVLAAEDFQLDRDIEVLASAIDQFRPSLLVLDGFRSLWPVGDENKSDDVTVVLQHLRQVIRRTRVGALLIHHSPKSGQTYRGSSAIAACADLAFVLERVESDEDSARRRLRCEKCRPAPEPPARWLRLASREELSAGENAISEAEPFVSPTRERAPVATAVATQVVDLVAKCGPMTRPEIARGLQRASSDGTLRRAVESATEDGRLACRGDGRYQLASHDGKTADNPGSEAANLPGAYTGWLAGKGDGQEGGQDER